ncbi:hypothetical protein CPB85DRAFT_1247036 [Mucidula mucida]|nr:hypothetical protein CPB85DRAFT_1247036 [Mucidula mucida]
MASLPTPQTTPKRASKMNSQAVNVNHLLNFTLPPRQSQPMGLPRRSRRTGVQAVWNKERFVNAQYRFVMNPMGDYTVHFADPDIFFQWNDIAQVIIPRSSALASVVAGREQSSQDEGHTNCPICLSPPTASRMTKCGHVFCYPCILHYLNTSENKWARCPICFDSINDNQLKNVKWFDGPVFDSPLDEPSGGASSSASSSYAEHPFDAPRAGSIFRMRLMQRPQITTLALPRSHTWPSDLIPPHQAPFYFLPDIYNYSKFMLATPDYLIEDLSKDLDELALERRQLAGMDDDLGVSFIDAAEQKVRNHMTRVSAMDNPILREQIDKARQALYDVEQRHALSRRCDEHPANLAPSTDVPAEFLVLRSAATPASTSPRPSSATRNGPRQRRNLNPPPPSTSTYYFYQAASGLPIFLHPLDIRILLSHFQSYPAFPDTIDIRVDALSEGTVNDDLRKRCKYLAHIPEGADVVFIEADLTSVVGKEGLKNFEGPLKMRTSRRKEKGKKDDRARIRAEERERERRLVNTTSWSAPATPPTVIIEQDFDATEETVLPSAPVSGAWGSRSFASTLSSPGTPRQGARSTRRDDEDEWDIDAAWHELESRNASGTGGRRKKSNKLVLIGGGGGPGRRR